MLLIRYQEQSLWTWSWRFCTPAFSFDSFILHQMWYKFIQIIFIMLWWQLPRVALQVITIQREMWRSRKKPLPSERFEPAIFGSEAMRSIPCPLCLLQLDQLSVDTVSYHIYFTFEKCKHSWAIITSVFYHN